MAAKRKREGTFISATDFLKEEFAKKEHDGGVMKVYEIGSLKYGIPSKTLGRWYSERWKHGKSDLMSAGRKPIMSMDDVKVAHLSIDMFNKAGIPIDTSTARELVWGIRYKCALYDTVIFFSAHPPFARTPKVPTTKPLSPRIHLSGACRMCHERREVPLKDSVTSS